MEAYDAAVLSYALATAATKLKPGFPPLLPPRLPESESLTPPQRQEQEDSNRRFVLQLLSNMEQQMINKLPVTLPQLMELCAAKQDQVDQQIIAYLESLQNELRRICKAHPTQTHCLILKFGDADEDHGVSLNTEVVLRNLSELFKQFGLTIGSALLKKHTN